MAVYHHRFPSIANCGLSGRNTQSVAADLDGTLLVSRSSFPYFMLLAVEAGSLLRGVLLLFVSPLVLFLYKLVSEAAGIHLLIFVSLAGVPMREIERVSTNVLPRFYAADVREDSWRVFHSCRRRRVVVTANPTVMVQPFVNEYLGGNTVLGTVLEVDERTGRATGFVRTPGVLVGRRKREAVVAEFGEEVPDLGLGDRESDHDFMALCKEGYMVLPDPTAAKVPLEQLCNTNAAVSYNGRFAQRPTPLFALLTFLWIPFGLLVSLPRAFFHFILPSAGHKIE